MEHKDIYNQTHKSGKKATTTVVSIALAGALLVGASKVASIKHKNVDTNLPKSPETTMVSPEVSELIFTEDFDINNPEEVSKRAEAIYSLSEKKCSVLDIQNSIYIINGMDDKLVYPKSAKSDDEKFDYLQQLALLFGITLDDYLADYIATMDQIFDDEISNPVFVGTTKSVPCAYMWMPSDSEAKKLAIEIAKVYYEQRANIRNNSSSAMKITANEYYDLFVKAKTLDLSTGDKVILFKQFSSINSLFTGLLNEKQANELDDALGYITTATNKLFSSAAENLDLSKRLKEDLEKGNFGKNITKLEEKYVLEDKISSEKIVESLNNQETTIINKGGKPASSSNGKQEVINDKVTTTISESEFVVEIPEGTAEVVIPGGDVVKEVTVTEPYTTGISERYVDADAIDAEKYAGNSFGIDMTR